MSRPYHVLIRTVTLVSVAGICVGGTYTFQSASGVWDREENWQNSGGTNPYPMSGDVAIIPVSKTCRVENGNEAALSVTVHGALPVIDKTLTPGTTGAASTTTISGTLLLKDTSSSGAPVLKLHNQTTIESSVTSCAIEADVAAGDFATITWANCSSDVATFFGSVNFRKSIHFAMNVSFNANNLLPPPNNPRCDVLGPNDEMTFCSGAVDEMVNMATMSGANGGGKFTFNGNVNLLAGEITCNHASSVVQFASSCTASSSSMTLVLSAGTLDVDTHVGAFDIQWSGGTIDVAAGKIFRVDPTP